MYKKLLATAAFAFFSMSSAQATLINLSATDVSQSSFTQSFGPGSYTVSLIKGLYSAWAPALPSAGNWTDYYKYTINGVDSYFNPLNSQRFSTSDAAFDAYSTQPQLQLNFTQATNVTFSIADDPNSFGDNAGGVSLSTAAVPEPASWLMMLGGFGLLGASLRRQRGVVATA